MGKEVPHQKKKSHGERQSLTGKEKVSWRKKTLALKEKVSCENRFLQYTRSAVNLRCNLF